MADEDKTPETEEKTPDSIQEEVETAASEEGAGDTSTVDTPDEAPGPRRGRSRRGEGSRGAAGGARAQGAPCAPPRRQGARRARAGDP